jgi:hypothetical protein
MDSSHSAIHYPSHFNLSCSVCGDCVIGRVFELYWKHSASLPMMTIMEGFTDLVQHSKCVDDISHKVSQLLLSLWHFRHSYLDLFSPLLHSLPNCTSSCQLAHCRMESMSLTLWKMGKEDWWRILRRQTLEGLSMVTPSICVIQMYVDARLP